MDRELAALLLSPAWQRDLDLALRETADVGVDSGADQALLEGSERYASLWQDNIHDEPLPASPGTTPNNAA